MTWKSTRRSVAGVLGAAALLTSCSDQGIVGGEWGGVTRIELTPSTIQLNAGESKPVTVRALDSEGKEVQFSNPESFAINWSSSDTSVAVVEGSGTTVQVRGVSSGDSRISVAVSPRYSEMRLSTSADVVVLAPANVAQAAAGDDQAGTVGEPLPQSLAVRIVDASGDVVPGVTVNFATSDGGTLEPASASTDNSGIARTNWRLGPRAGVQHATASMSGGASVEFSATANAGSPDTIRIQAGTGQTGTAGEQLRDTLAVRLADRFGNPVRNAAVSWAVVSGGGTVSPVKPNTDSTGVARAVWVLGSEAGTQRVRANSGNLSTEFAANATTAPPPNNPDPTPVAPSTVSDLRVVSTTTNSVTLSWTAVSDGNGGAAAYAIRTGTPTISWGAAYSTEKTVAPVSVGDTVTYTYTGLNAATSYQFQLVSYRGTLNAGAVFGGRSNIVTGVTKAPAVASVTVTPSSYRFTEIGQTHQLVATARDASGSTLSGISFSWSSSNSSIVSVDNMGRITARAAGTALIIACAAGCDVADTTNVEVDPDVVASITATPETHAFTAIGQTQQITTVARDESGNVINGVQFSYTSTASGIVSVDNNGRMTSRAAGTAAIIVAATCCSIADTVNAVVQVSEPPPTGSAEPLFSDNFDNGRRNSGNGFSWSGGDSEVTISSDRAYSGQYSMRFRFGPDAPGEDSSAEERFSFPAAPEVWIEFMLWIPSNYVHRDDSPGNNKLFALWGGGGDAYGRTGRAKVVIELWPIAGNDSQFRFLYNPAGSGTSHSLEWVSPAISANGPMRRGQWNRFRYYVKVGSGPNQGVVKAWVGNQLVYSGSSVDLYPNPATNPYFDAGYLLGWSNSGFSQVTDFFVDDFKIYKTNPGW